MKRTSAKVLVNSITMTRVIGTFLMPILSARFTAEQLVMYIIILLLTDTLDGLLARRFHVSTLFGALLDTLADKLLAIATLVTLARIYPIMWGPLALELIITFINISSGTKGAIVESVMLGKIKTWVLGICTVGCFISAFAGDFIKLFDNTTSMGTGLINIFKFVDNNSSIIVFVLAIIAIITDIIVAVNYLIKDKREINDISDKGIDYKKYKLKKEKELKDALFSTDFYEKTKGKPLIVRLGKVEE